MASGETDSSNQTIGGSWKNIPSMGIKVNIQQVLAMAGNAAPDSAAPEYHGFY